MRKLLIILSSALSLTVFAQQPDWVDPTFREEHYPAGIYYTGFSSAYVKNGEDKETAYDRLRQNARTEAVASIQVTVEQTIEKHMQNIQTGTDVSTKDIVTSRITTRTSIKDVPGLKVEIWENSKTGEVYAFAWVKATSLYRQLMRRIIANNAKAEVELESIETMANRGEKVQAKKNLKRVQELIDDVESDQHIMLSIDTSVTDEDMAVQETNLLIKRYQALTSNLKNCINIYLICNAQIFGQNYNALEGEMQSELNKLGVTFVTSPEQSDWAIYVNASAREDVIGHFGKSTSYTAYVDASVAIDKGAAGQRIFEEQLKSERGTHTTNFEEAARVAYKKISPQIGEIIKQHIQ